ncbi:ATP-binding protein [Listeria welshimeri]|nr:ATP-binding protein [Listeria welshimeri]MBC1697509.1 ATP-binding protein [Listeria welshimeri]
MPILDFATVTEEDLEDLIINKIGESYDLEYKEMNFTDGKLDSKQKDVLGKEITALANAGGGQILIGVQEGEQKLPVSLVDVGVNQSQLDIWQQQLSSLIATKTRPQIHGVNIKIIPIKEAANVILLDIPKSISRPHGFNTGSKDEFYIRIGNMTTFMDAFEIRRQVSEFETYKIQRENFINDRIASVSQGDYANGNKPAFLMHMIPKNAFYRENYLDIMKIKKHSDYYNVFKPLFRKNTTAMNLNADGLMLVYYSKEMYGYTQIFRNGIIEVAEFRLMNYKETAGYSPEGRMYPIDSFLKEILHFLDKTSSVLNELGEGDKYDMMCSMVNVKGLKTTSWGFEEFIGGDFTQQVDREVVKSFLYEINLNNDYDDTIIAVFDVIYNAFGIEEAPRNIRDRIENNY